jgi:sigma-E factor negative regulatory protein RseC
METEAIVTRLDGPYAMVELTRPGGGCGRCQEPGGCGGSVLGQVFGPGCRAFRLANTINARPGEKVLVRLGEGNMLRVALMVYLVPIVLLVAGAFAGMALADAPGDQAALIGAGFGLFFGIVLIALFQARSRRGGRLQPVLTRGPVSGS